MGVPAAASQVFFDALQQHCVDLGKKQDGDKKTHVAALRADLEKIIENKGNFLNSDSYRKTLTVDGIVVDPVLSAEDLRYQAFQAYIYVLLFLVDDPKVYKAPFFQYLNDIAEYNKSQTFLARQTWRNKYPGEGLKTSWAKSGGKFCKKHFFNSNVDINEEMLERLLENHKVPETFESISACYIKQGLLALPTKLTYDNFRDIFTVQQVPQLNPQQQQQQHFLRKAKHFLGLASTAALIPPESLSLFLLSAAKEFMMQAIIKVQDPAKKGLIDQALATSVTSTNKNQFLGAIQNALPQGGPEMQALQMLAGMSEPDLDAFRVAVDTKRKEANKPVIATITFQKLADFSHLAAAFGKNIKIEGDHKATAVYEGNQTAAIEKSDFSNGINLKITGSQATVIKTMVSLYVAELLASGKIKREGPPNRLTSVDHFGLTIDPNVIAFSKDNQPLTGEDREAALKEFDQALSAELGDIYKTGSLLNEIKKSADDDTSCRVTLRP